MLGQGMAMNRYSNLSGRSGVVAYELGEGFLKVQFRHEPKIYVYDRTAPGAAHVRKMSKLAIAGEGLSTYISQHVRENFAHTE
jgi:hypothetical protein